MRVRPCNSLELADRHQYQCLSVLGTGTIILSLRHRGDPYKFKFQKVGLPQCGVAPSRLAAEAGRLFARRCTPHAMHTVARSAPASSYASKQLSCLWQLYVHARLLATCSLAPNPAEPTSPSL